MSISMTEQEIREFYRRQGREPPDSLNPEKVKRQKYGNHRVQTNDGKFDSKHEEKCWQEIRLRLAAGEILGVGRQVIFGLPGGGRYVADFVVLEKDGTYKVYDAKSQATRKDKVYRLKKRQMQECNGVEIIEI